MKSTQYYPVLVTDKVAETAAFYVKNFRFTPAFESDWYVHLQSSEDPAVNLAILQKGHETIPPDGGEDGPGVILNFEVENPETEFEAAKKHGLPILKTLTDEAFGQRHFITRDPSGNMIDIIKPIPPSAEFAAQYSADALPQ
jgi:catechol 2,3-dioxygenase-like lactoylglutathione lyase family enzyme